MKQPAPVEFTILTALMISLVALSIDAMLPAFSYIRADLNVERPNDIQLILTLFFVGMAIGQLLFGPASDAFGRRPAIFVGMAIFVVGCVISILATSFETMLVGRLLQGLGAASPRTVMIALVRDRFEGRGMARVMSFVMSVFILVPALAPAIGQVILIVANWHAIFGMFLVLTLIAVTWFAIRQPETLLAEKRRPLKLATLREAAVEVFKTRASFGYMIASGLIFGAFVGYLNSAQQVFEGVYGITTLFPVYFGVLALSIGCASIVNAKLVMRLGMRLLASRALIAQIGVSIIAVGVVLLIDTSLPLSALMAWGVVAFFCMGILFANFNALAMEPLGHIAGMAASVIGSVATVISLILGGTIGQLYDGTILPLIGGFAVLGLLSLAMMRWTEAERED